MFTSGLGTLFLFMVQLVSRNLVEAKSHLPPSIDPFYRPSPELATTAPGTILKRRKIEVPTVFNCTTATAYQLLFRSTDSTGVATVISTTVIVPPHALGHLISFQFAYDTAAIDCGPSYTEFTQSAASPETTFLTNALRAGWIVSYPDYEGMDGAFSNGLQAGQAVLDSVRAVIETQRLHSPKTEMLSTAFVGASGGSLASAWALALQHRYAPELSIVGGLLIATIPNVGNVFRAADSSLFAGLLPSGLLGLAKQDPVFAAWLSEHLVDTRAGAFIAGGSRCLVDNLKAYANQSMDQYFDIREVGRDPYLNAVFSNTSSFESFKKFRVPLLVFKGIEDELSPVMDTDDWVRGLCLEGVAVDYQRAIGQNHLQSSALGFDAGFTWLSQRLNGATTGATCLTTNVTIGK